MAKKYLSPLNLLNLTSDPGTAAEGDFYWNSSTNRLRIYFDGAWADVSSNTAFTNDANTFTTAQTITPATSLTGLTINAASSAKGLIVKANATTPGNLQEWQDSTGTVLTNVESSGRVTSTVGYYTSGKISIGGASWSGGASMLNVWSTGTTSVPLTVRGVASQTGDLQQWQNSSGTVLMNITSGGDLGLSAIRATGGSVQRAFFDKTTESVRITPATTSHIGLVVKGIASQTADLQQWQDSAASVKAAISSAGYGTFSGITATANSAISAASGNSPYLMWSSGDGYRLQVFAKAANAGIVFNSVDASILDFQMAGTSRATLDASGNLTATSFVKSSGTSSQFLKADGSVDSSTYLTTGTASSTYLPLTGGTISSNLTITGDLVVNGTTTNLNSTNLVIEDKNIILGDVTTPSNTTADGGGITLKGATDKTFNWVNSTGYWTSNVGIEASSFVKTSGTSSQFLKADGSVDSSTYLTTGTASSTYAPLASPALTGTPTAPTAASSVSSTQIATTTYVKSLFSSASTSGTLDWNDVSNTRPGVGPTLLLGSATNGPGGGNYYHPLTIQYAATDGTSNVTQLAIAYGTPANEIWMRGRYSGTWSSWVKFATTTLTLSSFASTTSSQLAGVISDETGSGALVFANTPTLVTPVIGAATGTSLALTGALTAATKSFDIPHPTKENMRLRYGSLEGPENGVYIRGNTKNNVIELPDYWTGLVDESTITVTLTSIGKFQKVYVEKIEDNKVYIGGRVKEISYVIFGERKDTDKLIVEY